MRSQLNWSSWDLGFFLEGLGIWTWLVWSSMGFAPGWRMSLFESCLELVISVQTFLACVAPDSLDFGRGEFKLSLWWTTLSQENFKLGSGYLTLCWRRKEFIEEQICLCFVIFRFLFSGEEQCCVKLEHKLPLWGSRSHSPSRDTILLLTPCTRDQPGKSSTSISSSFHLEYLSNEGSWISRKKTVGFRLTWAGSWQNQNQLVLLLCLYDDGHTYKREIKLNHREIFNNY